MISFKDSHQASRRLRIIKMNESYQTASLLDERTLGSVVHLVVQSAGVAQVVPRAVATPQRRRNGSAVDALSAVHLLVVLVCFKNRKKHFVSHE